jgi:hypothetical protein
MFLVNWRIATARGSPVANGMILGICMGLQLYVFAEPLADCVLLSATALVVAVVRHRKELSGRVRPLVRSAAAALASFVVVGGYGLYILFAGPAHIDGAAHPVAPLLSSDLLGPILPTMNQHFTLGLGRPGSRLVGELVGGTLVRDGAENGVYIGIPLVLILLIGARKLRSRPVVRWDVGLAALAWIFSLGPRLRVDGHDTPVRLPFDVLAHLPVFSGAVAARFAMVEWWLLALLFGIELTAL